MKKAQQQQAFAPITIRSMSSIANALRRIRKLKKMSQLDLGKKVGMTQAMISRVESGTQQTEIGTLMLILSALNADLVISERPQSENKDSLEGLF